MSRVLFVNLLILLEWGFGIRVAVGGRYGGKEMERVVDKARRERWQLHLKTCVVCAAAKHDLDYLQNIKNRERGNQNEN